MYMLDFKPLWRRRKEEYTVVSLLIRWWFPNVGKPNLVKASGVCMVGREGSREGWSNNSPQAEQRR